MLAKRATGSHWMGACSLFALYFQWPVGCDQILSSVEYCYDVETVLCPSAMEPCFETEETCSGWSPPHSSWRVRRANPNANKICTPCMALPTANTYHSARIVTTLGRIPNNHETPIKEDIFMHCTSRFQLPPLRPAKAVSLMRRCSRSKLARNRATLRDTTVNTGNANR